MKQSHVSIIIPAFNEGAYIAETIDGLKKAFEATDIEAEIIVVDDGSSDDTANGAGQAGVKVLRHPCNTGYGNTIKTGVANASHEIIAIVDADGTYPLDALPQMVRELDEKGLDMLVGARQGRIYHGSLTMRLARFLFKMLCWFTVGHSIPDVNSGLRVMRKDLIVDFWRVLCGGFSITTTITLVSLLSGRFVSYTPISYFARKGRTKVRFRRDVLWTLQVIVRSILFYNPIKAFLALGLILLAAGVVIISVAIYLPHIRFELSLMSAFIVATFIIIAIGFVADQNITAFPDRKVSTSTKSK